MQRSRLLFRLSLLLCAVLPGAAPARAAGEPPRSLAEALAQGKVSLQLRARFEGVDQTGLRDAEAVTLRTRLGFTSAAWSGWSGSVEAESIAALDGDRYSQAGLNPGGAGRAVVADPTSTEINQAFLRGIFPASTVATLGRQRLVLDNARFIGDVGWRQNQQTFDAFTLQTQALPKTTLTYAYLHRIHRVFGDRHPQGNWKSASHVVHGARTGLPAGGTLAVYAYLLDFDNAAANACATYGLSYTGSLRAFEAAEVSLPPRGRPSVGLRVEPASLHHRLPGRGGRRRWCRRHRQPRRRVAGKRPAGRLQNAAGHLARLQRVGGSVSHDPGRRSARHLF
jgi:hypothetical protein